MQGKLRRRDRKTECLVKVGFAGGFELELELRPTRPHCDQGMILEDGFGHALPVQICAVRAVEIDETKGVFSSPDLQVAGGNDGSFGTLDDEVILRITSGAENVSPQAIGGFAQRAVPSSQRSLKISVFSRRVGVHEEKKWKTASKGRAVAEL